ncbi:MAG: hypothetical protein HZA37_01230 [Parcubacteria group bacterium]|nr:hypothetical protein [Parcubacteria group bacterium]
MNDYTIRVELKNGRSRQTTYQRLLNVLGLRDADYLGEPLADGTIAQVRHVVVILKGGFEQIAKVTVFDMNRKEVFSYGRLHELEEGKGN